MNSRKVLRNIATLMLQPQIGIQYLQWVTCRFMNIYPTVTVDLGTRTKARKYKLGAWTSFTEFHQRAHGIELDDRAAIDLCCVEKDSCNVSPPLAIDVGANIGCFSLALGTAGFHVIAFEPTEESQKRFANNLRRNPDIAKQIELHALAVGEYVGKIAFAIFPDSSEQNKIADALDIDTKVSQRTVEITTLDSFCKERNIDQIDFLKIDVEGFELQVLKGCERLIKNGMIKNIYLEVIPEALSNAHTSSEDIFAYLSANGFVPYLHGKFETTKLSPMDLQSKMSQTRNVLWRHRTAVN